MARPRKPKYEYVEKLKSYRKRIKDADGKYVAIYGKSPEELTQKLEEAQRLIDTAAYNQEYPTLAMYADKWMAIYLPKVCAGTQTDYRYIIEHFIKVPLGHHRMADITQDDIELALVNVNTKSESVYRKTTIDTYNSCREPSPVREYDATLGEWVETGMYQFDSKGALRALELLGKHLGMYNDKLQVSGTINTGQLDNVLSQLRGGGGG